MRLERGVKRLPDTQRGEPRFMGRFFAGYSPTCKRIYRTCTFPTQDEAREWYKRNRSSYEPSLNADMSWPDRWIKITYNQMRSAAKSRHIPFDLTFNQFIELIKEANGRCMLTGIRFEFQLLGTKSRRRPFAPSVDRIDSSKGYSTDNCRLICAALNIALGDWSMNPVMRIARALVARERRRAQLVSSGIPARVLTDLDDSGFMRGAMRVAEHGTSIFIRKFDV
jgi:hypothetical protein